VIAKIARIESTANTRSLTSTSTSGRNNGVASSRELSRTKNQSLSALVTGITPRNVRNSGFASGCSCDFLRRSFTPVSARKPPTECVRYPMEMGQQRRTERNEQRTKEQRTTEQRTDYAPQ